MQRIYSEDSKVNQPQLKVLPVVSSIKNGHSLSVMESASPFREFRPSKLFGQLDPLVRADVINSEIGC